MGEVDGCEGGGPTLYPPPRSQPPSANCTTELRPCNSPPPPPQPYAPPPPYACEGGLQAGVGYALGACQGWGAPPPYAPQADMPASLRAMSCCVARIRSSSASWAARRAPSRISLRASRCMASCSCSRAYCWRMRATLAASSRMSAASAPAPGSWRGAEAGRGEGGADGMPPRTWRAEGRGGSSTLTRRPSPPPPAEFTGNPPVACRSEGGGPRTSTGRCCVGLWRGGE